MLVVLQSVSGNPFSLFQSHAAVVVLLKILGGLFVHSANVCLKIQNTVSLSGFMAVVRLCGCGFK